MATDGDESGANPSAGPTLYLEPEPLDSADAFCTRVFDEPENEYRVVQLTTTQSFDSLRDTLDDQIDRIADPTAAAVIIASPEMGDDAPVSEVGDGTPLYGYRVNPRDLTGISIAFSRLINEWEQTDDTVKICLRALESLLPYHDTDLIYRFLNTILATLQGAGAEVHAHFQPSATDEQTLNMLQSLFAEVVEPADLTVDRTDAGDAATTDVTPAGDPHSHDQRAEGFESEPDDVATVTMSDDEIDAFLDSEGYGVLAFDGDSPYAIPMSYGYDTDERVFYLHLSAFEGSEKCGRLAESNAVSLVVSRYERPDQWRSVTIDGTLSRLSRDELQARNALSVFANSELASVDVFNRDPATVTFDWYVLTPDRITGRHSVGAP